MEEKVFNIIPSVLESLYKNLTPEIIKKELDVYLLSDILYKCLISFIDFEMDVDEMKATINEYEEEYRFINPFKVAFELNLDHYQRMMLYYMVTKTSIGEAIIDVDRMVSHFFKHHHEKILIKKY